MRLLLDQADDKCILKKRVLIKEERVIIAAVKFSVRRRLWSVYGVGDLYRSQRF